jgi:hypothetical protein
MDRKLRCLSRILLGMILLTGATAVSAFPEATPGLLHATLLNGLRVSAKDGALRLDTLQAMHLPVPPEGSHATRSDDPARKLWALLCTTEGTEVARFDFDSQQQKPPMWVLPYNRLTVQGEEVIPGQFKLAAGDYVLDFYLATGKFYSYPFAVKLVQDKYLVMGDWNSWGYLLFDEGKPDAALWWKIWLRRQETGNRDGVAARIEIVREADKKVIATSRPDRKQWLKDDWVRYDFDLIHPMQGQSGGAYFKAPELLGKDGAYTLKMSMEGAPYGVWKFTVAGGKLQLAGRADRETADPLSFVGGGGAYWYGSQAAVQTDPAAMAAPERRFAQKGFIADCKAITVNNTTLVMMMPLAKFFEMKSQWEASTKSLSLTHRDRSIKLTVGSATAHSPSGPVALGVAPVQRDGSLYAPLKPVAQALGLEVDWDAKTRMLLVIDGDRAGEIRVP